MKAKEFIKDRHRFNLCRGSAYMNTKYKLDIISGELKPRSLYYFSFKVRDLSTPPDVVLILGGGDTQYLWKIEN